MINIILSIGVMIIQIMLICPEGIMKMNYPSIGMQSYKQLSNLV